LTYEKPGPRKPRLLDSEVLRKHVADFPDQTFAERAEVFGVSKEGIHYALGKCGLIGRSFLWASLLIHETFFARDATLAMSILDAFFISTADFRSLRKGLLRDAGNMQS